MNEQAAPSVDSDGDNIHHYIESFTVDNANERGYESNDNISPGTSPTFYTMLLFFQAFCKYAFNHHCKFMKRNNPYFGQGIYGQLSCFMPEHIYLMKREVSNLIGDDGNGWKNIDVFAWYLEAISRVSKKSNHLAQEFFEKLPMKFINEYYRNRNKHIINWWRSDDLVLWMLGRQPELAREIACIITYYNNVLELSEDEHSDSQRYVFPNAVVSMDLFHNTGNETVLDINIQECMEFLMSILDIDKILKDSFIRANLDSIEKMATSDDVVRLFDKAVITFGQ